MTDDTRIKKLSLPLRLGYFLRRSVTFAWPDNCPLCDAPLHYGERPVCVSCLARIPRVRNDKTLTFIGVPGNSIVTRSWFTYNHDDISHKLIHDIKYHDRCHLARKLGRELAAQKSLARAGIDLIVPIPIHFSKLLKRGYNQTYEIARGIRDVTGIEVSTDLVAVKPHESQTRRNSAERMENVKDVFAVRRPQSFDGRHIALLDDVITTGATMMSAVTAIKAVSRPASVSFLSLARTQMF